MKGRTLVVAFLATAALLGTALTAEAGGFHFGISIGWGHHRHFPHYYYGGLHPYAYGVYAWTPYSYYGPVVRYSYYAPYRYRVYRTYAPAPPPRRYADRPYASYTPRAYGRVYGR